MDGEMMEAEKEINCKVDREVEEMLEVVCVLVDRGVGLLIKLVLDMEVVSVSKVVEEVYWSRVSTRQGPRKWVGEPD